MMNRTAHGMVGILMTAGILLAGCGTGGSVSAQTVQIKVNQVTNLHAFQTFLSDIHNAKPASVRIVNYTTEGDPVYTDLTFDGHQIRYTFDNTHDKFAGTGKGKQSTVCSANISRQSNSRGTQYSLTGCQNDQMPAIIAVIPTHP